MERKLYSMKCPRCGHTYQYEGEEYSWEHCPRGCGYQAPFDDFNEKELLPPPFYESEEEYRG